MRYGPGRNNNQDRTLGAELLANLGGLGFNLGQGSVPALAPVLDDRTGSTAGFPTSPFLPAAHSAGAAQLICRNVCQEA